MTSAAELPASLEAGGATDTAVDSGRPVALSLPLRVVVAVSLSAIVVIGTWNAWTYPTQSGYDASSHISYASNLIHHGTIPSQQQGGEYYTPPGYYAIAGATLWIGEWLGLHHPERLAPQLNVLFVLATALLLFYLCELLFPRRPAVRVSALAFFALLPVVSKAAGMFYPEPLNMLVSASAVTLATWMIVRRRLGRRHWIALAALLAVGQLVRASSVFTLAGVGLALVIALLSERAGRRGGLRGLGIGVAALVVIVTPWYARQAIRYHTLSPINVAPGFTQTILHPGRSVISGQGGLSHYLSLSLGQLYDSPVRPSFANEAIPTTYAEIWSDWAGYWKWQVGGPIGAGALRVMRDQILIGIVPTLLAIGGWAWLLWEGLRRRRELLPIALVPLVAVLGYLYRSYASATEDGDLLKAAYVLMTAPMWAIAFGLAWERLTRRTGARVALGGLLLVCALLELRFLPYGAHFGSGL